MKSFLYFTLIVAVLALGFVAFKAEAAPISWDYASGVLQPLQAAWSAQVKGSYFTATSTTASTFPYASTTAISASTLSSGNCVQASTGGLLTTTGTPCGSGSGTVTQINTTWPILGGPITTTGTLTFGGLSTSSPGITSGQPLYATGVNTIASVASSTFLTSIGGQTAGNYITALTGDVTASGPGSVAATLATVNSNVGSFTNANITVNAKGLITAASNGSAGTSGLSTTTPLSDSNLLVYSTAGAGKAYGVATSTLTATSPLTGSFTQVGSGGSLGCQTASGSQAGCLSSADWTTFNNKLSSAITAIGPTGQTQTGPTITLATSSTPFNGITASTTITGSGNTLTFSNTMAGLLGVGGGGTGQSSYTTGDLLYASGSSALSKLGIGTGGYVLAVSNGLPAWVATSSITGAVSSVSNSDSSLTISPTTGAVVASLNIGHANTWSALQSFNANASSTQLTTGGNTWLATTTGSVRVGPDANDGFPASVFNVSAASTNTGSGVYNPTYLVPGVALRNTNTTANNYEQYLFINGGGGFTGSIAGINETNTLVNPSGSIDIAVNNSGSYSHVRIDHSGDVGIGTSGPLSKLDVNGNAAIGSYAGTNAAPSNGLIVSGSTGIGTTSPFALLSVNAAAASWPFAVGSSTLTNFAINPAGQIVLTEERAATTTAYTLDWAVTHEQVLYQTGTSATTVTLINATTTMYVGSRKMVVMCNPASGTAGALTWVGVEWAGGTVPTQTTTAKACDVYSFFVTAATSTSASPTYKVFGAASTGFL